VPEQSTDQLAVTVSGRHADRVAFAVIVDVFYSVGALGSIDNVRRHASVYASSFFEQQLRRSHVSGVARPAKRFVERFSFYSFSFSFSFSFSLRRAFVYVPVFHQFRLLHMTR